MHIKYKILGLAALIAFCSSCKKFLDQQPNSVATDQTTWKSESDANASVASCYSLIRSAFNAAITYYSYGDLISDEFGPVSGGDQSYLDVQDMNWGISIPAANTNDPRLKLRLFTNFYTVVAQSNRCLHFINSMPVSSFTGDDDAARQSRKNHYLGEAYFTRAFSYFYMARVWGDVPLVTDYYDDVSRAPQLARSPQKDVLARCLLDLDSARQYLDWQDPNSSDKVVRADKGAVFALLAHLYAWEGDYNHCDNVCDSVINAPTGYTLVDSADYTSIYKGKSLESIFEIAQNAQSESMRATDVYTITGVTLAEPLIHNNLPTPAWTINTGLYQYLYSDTDDIRPKLVFKELSTGGASAYECIKYANIQNVNANTSYQIALNNIIVFRLADILLLKAEALAAKPAPDYGTALSLVNAVRQRAKIKTPLTGYTGNDLLNLITDERGRELFLEGHRFFDLIRLERITGDQQLSTISPGEFAAGKYYWPIDPSLFLLNSKLTQTGFWKGKVH